MDWIDYALTDGVEAYEPTRAHEFDAGADLRAVSDGFVPARGFRSIDTGVHVAIPSGFYGRVCPRSGLMARYGITTDGIIDAGYSGSISVVLFNHDDKPFAFKAGERIAQLVIMRCYTPRFFRVDEIRGGDRGPDGFGSTGRR